MLARLTEPSCSTSCYGSVHCVSQGPCLLFRTRYRYEAYACSKFPTGAFALTRALRIDPRAGADQRGGVHLDSPRRQKDVVATSLATERLGWTKSNLIAAMH